MLNRIFRALPLIGLGLLAIGCGNPSAKRIAQLQSPDVTLRRAAARVLFAQAKLEDQEIAALAKSVADSDSEVRYLSIDALGNSGPQALSSVPALLAALEDSNARVQVKAALAIHKIEPTNRKIVPVLSTALKAGDGRTMLAVGGMGQDAAWAVPTLVALLSHQQAQMRALAARTLGRIGPSARDAKAALQQAILDPNATVQRSARDALARIQSPSASAAK